MKRRKPLLWSISGIAVALCAAAFCACSVDGFSGDKAVPDTNRNEVLFIEQNRLSFALGMEIDHVDVIARCIGGVEDELGDITNKLNDGTITYEEFELDTLGSNKRIKISSDGAENYIYYDVNDYTANFYLDEEQTELYKTVKASAQLTDTLGLSVWLNMSQYNFSTDEVMREHDADRTMRFDGWHDPADNLVTGTYVMAPPRTGNERVVNFHAQYLTDEEFAEMELSYDGSGRRVFSGYKGTSDRVRIPEGVTYIDLEKLFKNGSSFKSLHISSTVTMEDIPMMNAVNSIGLEQITVDGGNARYASFNGALYSKDYSELYYMPTDCAETEFHTNLKEIGSYACAYWRVENLTLPNHLATLSHYCFAYSSLKEVQGLENVKTIKVGVFFGSNMNVFKDGDAAQYIVLDNGQYILSMILDESITSYKVIEGTIGIAASTFSRCEALKSVELCNGIKSIGSSAFSGCEALTEITLPQTLEKMGTNVFYGCKALQSVVGLTDVTFVDDDGLEYAHTLPTSTFEKCTSLTEIVLPDGVQIVGPQSFKECAALNTIEFPDSVEILGTESFRATGFTTITLPKNLLRLGNYAFMESNLTELDLTVCTKILSLPYGCFQETKLKTLHIPDRLTRLPKYCFYQIVTLEEVHLNKVTEIGDYAFGHCEALTYIDFGIAENIGAYAFASCKALTKVTLPDTVKTVGGRAFSSCAKLKEIVIGKNVETFGAYPLMSDGVTFVGNSKQQPATFSDSALEKFVVDEENEYFTSVDGVLYGRYIGGKDFGECGVLYAVPRQYKGESFTSEGGEAGELFKPLDSTRVILPYAFYYMRSLTKIVLNEGLENIGLGAFYNSTKLTTLEIPSTVSSIGAGILGGCKALKTFTIASSDDPSEQIYSTDGNLVYRGDTLALYLGIQKDFTIRDGTTKIDDGVFISQEKVTEIVIPDSVTEIGNNAFKDCIGLTSLTIGKGLQKFASSAFVGLSSLTTITVSPDNQYFMAENNVLYSKDGKSLILAAAMNGMTDLASIRSGVTEIYDYAFAYHKTLKSAVLPEGLKKIGNYAFYECRKLEELFCCESLESIGERAFSFASAAEGVADPQTMYCDTLKIVELYGNIKSIGDNAFYGQFGIERTYYHMTYEQVAALLAGMGKNKQYLTRGCPVGTTGTYYNNDGFGIVVALYSKNKPTIDHDGYEWYHYNEDGEPELYKNISARNPAE